MQAKTIRFIRGGELVSLTNVPPDRTLLEVLREDLAAADGSLHPAQEAMVQCHGSQCGFCTPGFVMSLFGMYQNHVCHGGTISRELAQEELSGNLCRCTGYRPILDLSLIHI